MTGLSPRLLKPQIRGRLAGPLYFGSTSRVERRPFGVVGASPRGTTRFSLAMAWRVRLPLFAGNTVVLKPSEVTPRVGEILREIFELLPSGVVTVIQGGGDVGAALVDAPCDKICFIGSPATGRKICGGCGEAPDSGRDGARRDGSGDRVGGCRSRHRVIRCPVGGLRQRRADLRRFGARLRRRFCCRRVHRETAVKAFGNSGRTRTARSAR